MNEHKNFRENRNKNNESDTNVYIENEKFVLFVLIIIFQKFC